MKQTPSVNQIHAFNQCYRRYYPLFAYRCTRAVKDDVVASGMVQDAFLKVWLLWDQIEADAIYDLLKLQLKKAIFNYYDTAKNRFHASLFRLDELENADFLLKVMDEEVDEPQVIDDQDFEKYKEQWLKLQQLMPVLSSSQRQLIQLCLKYNFSYDRMAYYLGGISDYVVARQVEDLLKNLKQILTDGEKLQQAQRTNSLTFTGNLDELQANVMRLRYELQYSFGEIAGKLGLAEVQVKQAYASACRVCR